MGVDVGLIAKYRDKNFPTLIFSRDFRNFLSRAYQNSEFDQIQQILNIDLSIFLQYPVNVDTQEEEGRLEYEIYLAEQQNDMEKVQFF